MWQHQRTEMSQKKEAEKGIKYKNFCVEIQRKRNIKCIVLSIIIGAKRRVTKCSKKNLKATPAKHSVDSPHKTAVLGKITRNTESAAVCAVGITAGWREDVPGRKYLWEEEDDDDNDDDDDDDIGLKEKSACRFVGAFVVVGPMCSVQYVSLNVKPIFV